MLQPVWITPAGSLGVIPEGVFYSVPVEATAGDEPVYFQVIAGELPDGIQVTSTGLIQGTPRNVIRVQGSPLEVAEDVTSKFAIRAYTVKIVNGNIIVDRLADRTFSITVSGPDAPRFITPSGNVGTFYDGTEASVKIDFYDPDPNETRTMRVLSGQLPPGLVLNSRTGLISGVIIPLTGVPGTAPAGYDDTPFSEYPYDFSTRATNKNYQFTLEVTDGKLSDVRTFEIFVYAKNTMNASTTEITSDNTFVTADVTPDRAPVLLTPEGDLGIIRADNWYAFKFEAIDFDGAPIEYIVTTGAGIGYDDAPYDVEGFDRGNFSLPPGLQIDPVTGWFYGYIPDQGATEKTYRFAVRVRNKLEAAPPWNPSIFYLQGDIVQFGDSNYTANQNVPPGIFPTNDFYWTEEIVPISRYYYFTITITGQIDTDISWITPEDLGTINNGATSHLNIEAINIGGRPLQYRIMPGSPSRLPQGLTLLPSGNIVGRVSFNTFALDGGLTTFDVNSRNRTITGETTFDSEYRFTVNAFSSETQQIGYQIGAIVVPSGSGGLGYTSQPTITISAPPNTAGAIQATAGVATIVNGSITSIALGNPGRGYISPPTITITGGGGVGASAFANLVESSVLNSVSVFRIFHIKVIRAFNEPYETLYVKCMPPFDDRSLITQLIQNQDIIPDDLIYRADDPNFGKAQNVTYTHAYGLTPSTYSEYMSSLAINHYWKNVTLGEIRTARALDSEGNVLYEVVYSIVIDDLVNNLGESVSKRISTPYPVELVDNTVINTVYPNSLVNMRDQVIDTVGQVSPALPLWMISKQSDGRVLGFVPAWVITYVKPGEGNRIAYNIRQNFGSHLNLIDFKIDRYELNRSQTYDWDPNLTDYYHPNGNWVPQPPVATVFDEGTTIFDGNGTVFITPADRWTNTDEFDKYLVFPRTNILN